MKITNNHKGPLGLSDGTILLPGEATPVVNWNDLKKNAVVKGWLDAGILTAAGGNAAQPSLLGSDLLPSQVHLVDDVAVALGDVVRRAHEASGLSIEGWNELDSTIREAKLADAVEQLRSEAINAAEASKAGAGTGTGDAGGSTGTSGAPGSSDGGDKDALIARAKALGIAAKATWGVPKLQEAIAAAEAKKGEG